MKHALTALSLVALATIAYAGVEVTTNPELRCALQASPQVAVALDL
jgi:hypothetical protein